MLLNLGLLGGIAAIICAAAILRFGFHLDPFRSNVEDRSSAIRSASKRTKPRINAPPSGPGMKRTSPSKNGAEPPPPVATKLLSHYFSTPKYSTIRYLDWRNDTWENDISSRFDVVKVTDGYRIRVVTDGYEHKMILFPAEDVESKKLHIAFTVEAGTVNVHLRPTDLSPKGISVSDWFHPAERYSVTLWVDRGEAKGTVNGKMVSLVQVPDCDGYFAILVSRDSSLVIHELHFTELETGRNS